MADTTFLHHIRDEIDAEIKAQEGTTGGGNTGGGDTGGGTGGGTTAPLAITSVSPLTGDPSTLVTVTGTGFGAAQGHLAIAIFSCAVVSWSDTQITMRPYNLGSAYDGQVVVVSQDGRSLAGPVFKVTAAVGDTGGNTGGGSGEGTGGDTGSGGDTGGGTGSGGTGDGSGGSGDTTGGSEGGIGYVSGGNGSDIVVSFKAPQPLATFKTVAGMSLQMTQPVLLRKSEEVFTWNDPNTTSPPHTFYGSNVPDEMAGIVAGPVQFAAKATGLMNVEVWLHGAMKARFTPDAAGNVSGMIDLTGEKNGPLVWDVYAWNSAPFTNPTDGNYRQLKQRAILFVTGGTDYVMPAIPAQASALGLKLRFSEDFVAPLDVSKTGTTAKWYPSKPEPFGEGQFGSAAFTDPADLRGAAESPFFQRRGFLRVRYRYEGPNMVDPFVPEWKRKWTTGMLSTGKPSGVGGFYQPIPYYAECRFLAPVGGVPWPAFWQLTKEGLVNPTNGNVETDTVEAIGLFPANYRAGGIHYKAAGGVEYGSSPAAQPATYPTDKGCFEFHTYGCLVTPTETTMFLDGVSIGSFPTQMVDNTPTRSDFFMINHGGGGGGWEANWESTLPGSDHYDMWVSDMRVWGL